MDPTYEDFDVSEVKEFFDTPKSCYRKLSLEGEVTWYDFYRLWNSGRARRSVGLMILTSWRLWKMEYLKKDHDPTFALSLTSSRQAALVSRDQDTLGPR